MRYVSFFSLPPFRAGDEEQDAVEGFTCSSIVMVKLTQFSHDSPIPAKLIMICCIP
jgi:hypothetical protein